MTEGGLKERGEKVSWGISSDPQQRELPLHSLYHAVIPGGTYGRSEQVGGHFGPPPDTI
jgi:hypothetical protein